MTDTLRNDFIRSKTPVRLRNQQNSLNQLRMSSTSNLSRISRDHSQVSYNNAITQEHTEIEESKQLMSRSKSQLTYFSQKERDNSANTKKSQISKQKDQKLSIDYFLGTAQKQKQQQKKEYQDKTVNVLNQLQNTNEKQQKVQQSNSQHIISNLKTIFFEHSQFVEGGTMGSTIQPINSNLMTLYLFHQFLKKYDLVQDATQSQLYEMIFLSLCDKQTKKLTFNQFASVLAKISMKLYANEFGDNFTYQIEPLDFLLKIIDDYLFSLMPINEINECLQDKYDRYNNQIDNEFERYRNEYFNNQIILKSFLSKDNLKIFKSIFDKYTKASKRGVKIIPLRQFKWMMRDLAIIPHITTEYKCGQLFKYLDSCKQIDKNYPEEILTLQTFPLSMYIVFSLTLEDETDMKKKIKFIMRWLQEHAKNKLAGTHATREDRRLKFTNEKLQQNIQKSAS